MTTFPLSTGSSKGEFYSFRLLPHTDLKTGILEFAQTKKLRAAAIVTCVGSLERCVLRYATQPEGTVHEGHFEIISLVGTFNGTSAHLHLSISDKNGETIGGHLMPGSLVYTTAEIVIVELESLNFERSLDATYGYQELVITNRKG